MIAAQDKLADPRIDVDVLPIVIVARLEHSSAAVRTFEQLGEERDRELGRRIGTHAENAAALRK